MKLRKILIVDSNDVNRQILLRILSDEYEVLEARSGAESLCLLKTTHESISAVLLDTLMPQEDGYQLLSSMRADPKLTPIPVIVTADSSETDAEIRALSLGAHDFIRKPYNPAAIKHRLRNTIHLRETASAVNALRRDKLTGLYSRETFFEIVAELVAAEPPNTYVMACFDIDNFKVINDQYGSEKGDFVLKFIADTFRTGFEPWGGVCCRVAADNFAVLYPVSFLHSPELSAIRRRAAALDGSIAPISFSIGRYIVDDLTLPVSAMYDRPPSRKRPSKRALIRISRHSTSPCASRSCASRRSSAK